MTGWPGERSRHGGIDEIPLSGVPGRLWLCGKHAIAPDPEACLASVGATVVVCLNEPYELIDRYPQYVAWLGAGALGAVLWCPIPDLGAPSLDRSIELVEALHLRLAEGAGVVMHCGAGIGRAGTMAAALLMRLGATRVDACRTVATHRPMGGPEAGAQVMLLEALEQHHWCT